MTSTSLHIVTAAPVSTGTMVWRARGQLYVSIAVKATFALVHDRAMEAVEPVPVVTGELHHRNNPSRSVRATTDVVPYLGRADVVLTGHACAPEGQPAPRVLVRLAVLRDRPLLDKTIEVHGDRKDGVVQPFDRIPLVYERSLGGVGWDDNPLGAGCRPGAEPDTSKANLLDPAHPTRTAGFGPLSRMWPARRRLLGGLKRRALDEAVVELPDGFDWSYFHAAPVDQRIELLRGDEWIVLEGVHPHLPQIRSRLPDARVRGMVTGLSQDGAARALQLVIDMLRIDADQQTCSAVWRCVLPVRDEATLAALTVTLALEVEGQGLEWSEAPASAEAPREESIDVDDEATTIAREDEPAPREARAPRRIEKTVAWSPEDEAGPNEPPVAAGRPPATDSTYALSLDDQDRAAQQAAVPFAPPASPAAPQRLPEKQPLPGAPWAPAGTPARRPSTLAPPRRPPAQRSDETLALDLDLDDLEASPPAAPPQQPSVAPPPLHPPAGAAAPPRPISVPPPGPPPEQPAGAAPRAPTLPPPARRPPGPRTSAPSLPPRAQDAIPVVGASPFTTFTFPWQIRERTDSLVVVVKATCDLVPDGRAVLRDSAEPASGDVHEEGDPMRTVRYPSDFVPFKPRADVVLAGHAYPPGGSSPAAQVRFRFGHRKNGFERRIAVFGERRWVKAGLKLAPMEPKPFKKVPLVFERAFGGPGFARNPVGVGRDTDCLPQLEDPAHLVKAPGDTPEPACFAAVPLLWPARWSRLGTFDAAWKKSRWPYLPDDADWAFSQAAPASQQLDHLVGDEPFEIAGVHAEHPVVTGALPGVRPRCFLQKTSDAGGDFHEVVLRLDTVAFDADAMKVDLVWRGAVDVRDDEASDVAELFVFAEPVAGPAADRAAALARYEEERARPPEDPLEERAANDALPPAERTPEEAAALRAAAVALLAGGGTFAGMDLVDADLEGLDLSGHSFAGALLRRARLRGAKLRGADLTGALLADADLAMADLTGATAADADFSGADLTGALLSGVTLDGALFRRARGDGARFDGARGAHASFESGSWKKARFSSAELPAADFSQSALDGAVLDGATLPDVRLYDAHGSGVSCKGATLVRARADGAVLRRGLFQDVRAPSSVWDRATLDESTFLGAVLAESGFAKASCRRAIFSGTDLSASRLRRGRFPGALFVKASLMGASLEAADLEGADLRGANLHGAETHKARLDGARLDLAIVTQTKLAENA